MLTHSNVLEQISADMKTGLRKIACEELRRGAELQSEAAGEDAADVGRAHVQALSRAGGPGPGQKQKRIQIRARDPLLFDRSRNISIFFIWKFREISLTSGNSLECPSIPTKRRHVEQRKSRLFPQKAAPQCAT